MAESGQHTQTPTRRAIVRQSVDEESEGGWKKEKRGELGSIAAAVLFRFVLIGIS